MQQWSVQQIGETDFQHSRQQLSRHPSNLLQVCSQFSWAHRWQKCKDAHKQGPHGHSISCKAKHVLSCMVHRFSFPNHWKTIWQVFPYIHCWPHQVSRSLNEDIFSWSSGTPIITIASTPHFPGLLLSTTEQRSFTNLACNQAACKVPLATGDEYSRIRPEKVW